MKENSSLAKMKPTLTKCVSFMLKYVLKSVNSTPNCTR